MTTHKPKLEVAHILNQQLHLLHNIVPNAWKRRTLFAIAKCRTALLGGHIDRCNNPTCKTLHLSYNSCRNRHCPKCQGQLREQWIRQREAELLNTHYFHLVFTLPQCLNPIALTSPKLLYATLFKAAWSVLHEFGANPKFLGAKTGMIALLHTWGQNLSLHPHLHCIVPAGGINRSGKWKAAKGNAKFLFPVRKMSSVFRARILQLLRKQIKIPQPIARQCFQKPWVIYAKRPFNGPKQVIEYIGRYSHKVAISNHRILKIENDNVFFKAKNYRKGGEVGVLKLSSNEFIRRFALHILPKGFTRIRHYGILSSSLKKKAKILIEKQIGTVKLRHHKPKPLLHRRCPHCKKGTLKTIYTFDLRGPPKHWKTLLNTPEN